MPRVGDGTGEGTMPPTEEGLRHTGGDSAEKASGVYRPGSGSGASQAGEEGSRNTPLPKGKME